MHITIPNALLTKMTDGDLKSIDRTPHNVKGRNDLPVDLLEMDDDNVTKLRETLQRLTSVKGSKAAGIVADIDRWRQIVKNGANGQERPRTVRQFADLIVQYIMTSNGHRIYEKQQDSGEWLAYYVNYVEYENEQKTKGSYSPARTTIHTLFWRLGEQHNYSVSFHHYQTDGLTVAESMSSQGLIIETPDLREHYLKTKERLDEIFPKVGRQYTTSGYGTELDGKFSSHNRCNLMQEGVPAKVVIDIVGDSNEANRQSRNHIRTYFWASKKPKINQKVDSDELSANEAILDHRPAQPQEQQLEIPVHPYVPVYHLFRHQRFRVNVMELDEYVFNKQLGHQLVLPQVTKNLVDVLVSQGRVSFQDIIAGKGSGACVLLGGPPGVGKTLTAEVFAEATERPLLSVQAAQLGTSPDNIEKQLYDVLRRGSRWNAVVLLDEADVYIDERGGNIQQNAVVAAFLRVLENHTATIFMTTNRIDHVDDAIASRCLARIDYAKPSKDDQQQIWKVLNDINDTALSADQIKQIVDKHDDLSGRDIKQLLKLASLWSKSQELPITTDTIDFVISFLPTRTVKDAKLAT